MNREIENFLSSFKYQPKTKESYRRILHLLIAVPDLEQMDAIGLIQFIDRPGWGNSQQNVALFCAKKFLKWKYNDKHSALLATIPHVEPKPRRVLNEKQALQILASFNTYTIAGARDLAIIVFGLDTGFRRAELCSVELKNVDFDAGSAATICKGGQWGWGAFSPETSAIVQRWLNFRLPAQGVDNLFTGVYDGRAITGYGFASIFKRLSKRIGFQISPHDLRSSHATFAKIFGASDFAGMIAGRWKTQKQYHHYIGSLRLNIIRPHLPVPNLMKR